MQREIQERLKALGIQAAVPAVGAPGTGPAALTGTAAAAVALIQKKRDEAKKWAPLILNKEGKHVDDKGNVVTVDPREIATLKVGPLTCSLCVAR